MDGQFDDAPDDVTELKSFHHTENGKETIEVSLLVSIEDCIMFWNFDTPSSLYPSLNWTNG